MDAVAGTAVTQIGILFSPAVIEIVLLFMPWLLPLTGSGRLASQIPLQGNSIAYMTRKRIYRFL
jgi:hypothetical protein